MLPRINGVARKPQRPRRLDLSAPAVDVRDNEFRLKQIPAAVLNMTHLTELWLSNNTLGAANNSLQGIPAEIGRLRGLRVLAAENCALMSVPAEIAQLARLETLPGQPAERAARRRRAARRVRGRASPGSSASLRSTSLRAAAAPRRALAPSARP